MKFMTNNNRIDSEDIQMYVERFLEVYNNNSNSIKKGATPKIINDIFMEGFTPPIIKSIIKKTGSSDLQTTLAYLPTLYSELEIYLRWKQKCEETGDNETGDKSDKLKIMRKFNEDNAEKIQIYVIIAQNIDQNKQKDTMMQIAIYNVQKQHLNGGYQC